jgi:hypothetical protein
MSIVTNYLCYCHNYYTAVIRVPLADGGTFCSIKHEG